MPRVLGFLWRVWVYLLNMLLKCTVDFFIWLMKRISNVGKESDPLHLITCTTVFLRNPVLESTTFKIMLFWPWHHDLELFWLLNVFLRSCKHIGALDCTVRTMKKCFFLVLHLKNIHEHFLPNTCAMARSEEPSTSLQRGVLCWPGT